MENLLELITEISKPKYLGVLKKSCLTSLGKIFHDKKRRNVLEKFICLQNIRSVAYDLKGEKIPVNPDNLNKDFVFASLHKSGEIIYLKKWSEKFELLGHYKCLPVEDFIKFVALYYDSEFSEIEFESISTNKISKTKKEKIK